VYAALRLARELNSTIFVDLSFLNFLAALFDAGVICWAIRRDRRSGVPTDGLHRLGIAGGLAADAVIAIPPSSTSSSNSSPSSCDPPLIPRLPSIVWVKRRFPE
jgi:hypothetical protein